MMSTRLLRLAHFIGLALFLGSIFAFIVISTFAQHASLENLAFARRIISGGTDALTVPGMWLLAATGVWMGYTRYGTASVFFRIKAILVALIIVNAYLLVVPAVQEASAIAARSLSEGHLLAEYQGAYLRESVFGAGNILLALAAAAVGVWKPGATRSLPRD